ncbi:hypothetical protein CU098_002421 [Rhizopus stolonifer]|uniref:Uncharacterized protein n=1 Tax=Rhizopus stolonifer TaxID=4846 RepID=A0A367ILC3_RHIST|nr:hypothetical protein CU098_002421 [Rhizopus stolonifer]
MSVEVIYIVVAVFCSVATLLITSQVIKNPNRLRMFVMFYSIVTLPATVINALAAERVLDLKVDVLIFLISTLLKVVSHFLMILSVGHRLRLDQASWNHPLILFGSVFLVITVVAILLQLIFVTTHFKVFEKTTSLFYSFVVGLIAAIFADAFAFTYTFLPLMQWKRENRENEGNARNTAIGLWFFVTQWTCYTIQVALYLWFMISYDWDYFVILLAIEYSIRFIQNLLYTWRPPKIIVNFLTTRICTSNTSTVVDLSHTTPPTGSKKLVSETYNEQTYIEYETASKDLSGQISTYSDIRRSESNVSIVPNNHY